MPARYGDSIWITYGKEDELHYILIDGGTAGTAESIVSHINEISEEKINLELVVVSHIDQDHIAGILKLLNNHNLSSKIGDFWFNGWQHLQPENLEVEEFGAKQAEGLSIEIQRQSIPWNNAFKGKAISITDVDALPVITLPGGLRITILSPLKEDLLNLKPVWAEEIIKAGLVPGYSVTDTDKSNKMLESFGSQTPDVESLSSEPFEEDGGVANASSIAFIAEFANKRVLFAADALPSKILHRLESKEIDDNLVVDLLKVSHHASAGNTSNELIDKLNCSNFLISTNGSNYHHPSPNTIARLIKRGGPGTTLFFNYRTPYNSMWDNALLKDIHKYNTEYPIDDNGITVDMFKL